MDDAWKRLLALAESQFGVITVAQAKGVGVEEHKLRYQTGVGRLVVVRPSVLRVAGVAPDFCQRAKAVTLWLGPASTISHDSAPQLLRLDSKNQIDDVHVSLLSDRS